MALHYLYRSPRRKFASRIVRIVARAFLAASRALPAFRAPAFRRSRARIGYSGFHRFVLYHVLSAKWRARTALRALPIQHSRARFVNSGLSFCVSTRVFLRGNSQNVGTIDGDMCKAAQLQKSYKPNCDLRCANLRSEIVLLYVNMSSFSAPNET